MGKKKTHEIAPQPVVKASVSFPWAVLACWAFLASKIVVFSLVFAAENSFVLLQRFGKEGKLIWGLESLFFYCFLLGNPWETNSCLQLLFSFRNFIFMAPTVLRSHEIHFWVN